MLDEMSSGISTVIPVIFDVAHNSLQNGQCLHETFVGAEQLRCAQILDSFGWQHLVFGRCPVCKVAIDLYRQCCLCAMSGQPDSGHFADQPREKY